MTRRHRLKSYLFSRDLDTHRGWRGRLLGLLRLAWITLREFHHDFCFERAASLTYATIISLIPLSVLFFSLAGMMGGGDRVIDWVQNNLLEFLVPEQQDAVKKWLERYISKDAFQVSGTAQLVNVAAIVSLFVAALGVLLTAERVFNRIWSVRGRRSIAQKAMVFGLILFTSPLLIAASIQVTSVLVPKGGPIDTLKEGSRVIGFLYDFFVPFFVAWIGFTILFLFLPSTRVQITSAAIGGLISALLWQASKTGFAYYVERATTVTNFYQQIAAVPLFLIWLYVSWAVTLLGGELGYAHQNLATLSRRMGESVSASRSFAPEYLGLCVLGQIGTAFAQGAEPPTVARIADRLDLGEESLSRILDWLVSSHHLVEDSKEAGRYYLARHPRRVRLREVVHALRAKSLDAESWVDEDGATPSEVLDGLGASTRLRDCFEAAQTSYLDAFGDRTLEDVVDGGPDDPGAGR